jgi:hypothetical protein
MRLLEEGAAQQFGGGISGQLARILVRAKDPAVLVDFDDAGSDMLVVRRAPEPGDTKGPIGSILDDHALSTHQWRMRDIRPDP